MGGGSADYRAIATTTTPTVTLATAGLATGNYQVQVIYTRAGEQVTILSGHAPLVIQRTPAATAPATIPGLADFVVPPDAQVQVAISPFHIAQQSVPLQIQFGHKLVNADGSLQPLMPEDLKQPAQVLLPHDSQLPPGHYSSQVTILVAQIPENGTDF